MGDLDYLATLFDGMWLGWFFFLCFFPAFRNPTPGDAEKCCGETEKWLPRGEASYDVARVRLE